jgi:acetyl-CoA carboxylase biotin carboxylase subunit
VRRVLVANRGEIAVRIVQACVDAGLESVVVVSEADRESRAAVVADQVIRIGPAPAGESYLVIERIVAAALATGCDAVHPGYGFLAERPELADACAANDLVFVGPSADTIRRGGDKAIARSVAESLGIPVGMGSGIVADAAEAVSVAEQIGYPVVLKAAAGGGGRGMIPVDDPAALAPAFAAAGREAQQAFGDGRMYVERFITRARHVEVQILGDRHGGLVHLGERDCSVQRRYQKLVEEAPATAVEPSLRAALADAALELARELGYVGAGTVEFIVDADTGEFAFLEVNTRVQVEHPVTEMVTGIDVVRAQLAVAAGQRLGFSQRDVRLRGHAVEARLNAEDPDRGFAPCPGLVERWIPPVGSDVRVDTHIFGGYRVPPHYDSMVAKVIARGDDRAGACANLDRALEHCVLEGFPTTLPLVRGVLAHPDFVDERHHTRWVEQTLTGPVVV